MSGASSKGDAGRGDYGRLLRRMRELMRDPPDGERLFGTGGVPDGDIQVRVWNDGDVRAVDGRLITDPAGGGDSCVSRWLFSFRRKGESGAWTLECDERLCSHWLWKELRRLERRGPNGSRRQDMNRKERDELHAVYQTLVMAEHDSSKYRTPSGVPAGSVTKDWLEGYNSGVGHALDLLGNFMGLGTKIGEEY